MSSEHRVEVVRLGPITKHPDADTLSITTVLGGYPVILRTGEYKEGDLAVYVPIDSVVPENDPRWEFLGGSAGGARKGRRDKGASEKRSAS